MPKEGANESLRLSGVVELGCSLSKVITKTEQEGIEVPISGLFGGEWEMFRAATKTSWWRNMILTQ